MLLVTGPDGVLLVDGGSPEHSADFLKVVAEQSGGRKVQTLFNTHWHLESTGSNDALGKAGATIIAHENTKLWMGTDIICKWRNKTYQPRAKEALPNQTFYTTGKMTFGKEQVEYGYLGQAHTDGDIYVFFPGPEHLDDRRRLRCRPLSDPGLHHRRLDRRACRCLQNTSQYK